MRALVTGTAGFIGSHLSTRLLQEGADVVGIDCFTDYYPRWMKEQNLSGLIGKRGFAFVETSLQTADLPRLLDGITHVFHLAAQAGVRKSWGSDFATYVTHNIDGTQRLLEAVKQARIEKLVYASSSSIYGDEVEIPMRGATAESLNASAAAAVLLFEALRQRTS